MCCGHMERIISPAWQTGYVPFLVALPPMPQTHVRAIEVDAVTTSAVAVTGGNSESRLTVEYYLDAGATSASVTLTIVSEGQTTTWSDTNIVAGYHVHDQLPSFPPGAKLTLQASTALARVRWCESYWS